MIAGVHVVQKRRPGRPSLWYVYAYRGGPQIGRYESRDKPRLDTETLRRLLAAQEALSVKTQVTLRDLIRKWRPSSPEWRALADTTKKTWGSALDRIEERWGDTPLTIWSDPRMVGKVMAWRDSRDGTPRAADMGVTVLRSLLEFGRLRALVSVNVASNIPKLYKNGTRAEIVWLDEDIEKFRIASEELRAPHVYDGLRLAALTGLRRADLVSLTWNEISENAIQKKAAKASRGKRRFATMPIIPELGGLLAELRNRYRRSGVEHVLVNSRGVPWTGDGFGTSFNRVRDHAGIVFVDPESGRRTAKHVHDLRGTFCTKLLKAGLTDHEVADIMAWSPEQVSGIRRTYVDQSAVIVAIGERIRRGL